jgi:DNA gyrase subunit A
MKHIQGPDFPTGGIVANQDELLSIYETGAGKIKVRGRLEVEKAKGGKEKLVITEIPYPMIGANIGKFLNDVYSLVETKKTSDIVDISNQSSKEGIRIVLDLRKGCDVDNLCNLLYKKTRLEDTFGVNMLAVAEGRPEVMGLKQVIRHHVEFRFDVATRKYKYLLAKELDKKEVQEGLIKAYDIIDLIIEILRGSKNIKDARACMIEGNIEGIQFKNPSSEKLAAKLRFTERQANAILEMPLKRLIGLELEALLQDHDTTLKLIAEYEDILGSRTSMARVIIKELDRLRKEYGKPRKTGLENAEEVVYEEKKIEEMPVVILVDRFSYAKTIDMAAFERNQEAAYGENSYVIPSLNTDKLAVFTDKGQLHLIKVSDIPFGKFRDKGKPIDNMSNYSSGEETIVFMESLHTLSHSQLLFVSKTGMVKRVQGQEFDVSKRTTAATKLNQGDSLLAVGTIGKAKTLVLQSEKGMFLRFPMESVSEMKKTAVGVRGIRLDKDQVAATYVLGEEEQRIPWKDGEISLNRLRIANRDTKGVKK